MPNVNFQISKLILNNILIKNGVISIGKMTLNELSASLYNENAITSRPSYVFNTLVTARYPTICEICHNNIIPGSDICKGVYENGTETEKFIHRECCN